jgi:hypothetical protein
MNPVILSVFLLSTIVLERSTRVHKPRGVGVLSVHFNVYTKTEFSRFVNFRNHACDVLRAAICRRRTHELVCVVSCRVTTNAWRASAMPLTSSGAVRPRSGQLVRRFEDPSRKGIHIGYWWESQKERGQ